MTLGGFFTLLANLAGVICVGGLFGILIGSSAMPMATTAAPLVFGLLAVIGVGASSEGIWQKLGRDGSKRERATISIAVVAFCVACLLGIYDGQKAGSGVRRQVGTVLKDAGYSKLLPHEDYVRLQLLSAAAIKADLPPAMHDNLLGFGALPILIDETIPSAERRERVDAIIDRILELTAEGDREEAKKGAD